jgi:hypothetical protein
VEAQALLKVRLDKIAEIINRVLTTIDRNPEIVDQIVPPLGAVASELERTAGRSVDEVSGAVGSTASDLDRSVADAMTGEPGVSDAMAGEPGVSDATAEEQVVADAPQQAAEPAGSNEGTPRGILRRLKQERNTEELSP